MPRRRGVVQCSPQRAAGFTMVELIVVLLVMGVLAAVAVPRLSDRSAMQERGAQDQLRGMLVHARRLAVTQNREVCLLLAPAQVQVVYVAAGVCSSALPVADPGGGGAWRLDMPPRTALGGAALVRFNTRGQPVPAADSVITIGSLSLTVARETGFAL